MARILIALSSTADEQALLHVLPPMYQPVVLDGNGTEQRFSDACIFDLEHWPTVKRITASNVQMARLLLTSVEDISKIPVRVQDAVDDIIKLPLNPTELAIRLRNVLRMKDHTERQRRIYQQLATTNKALESTSDAIIIADGEGLAIYTNPAFGRAFGYNVNELNVGGIPNVLFERPIIGERIFQQVRQDSSWKGEVQLKTKLGKIVTFLLNIDSIEDDAGNHIGFISIGTDITQHKRMNAIEEEQRILAEAQLDTAKALTSTLDLDEVFERILENISQVVPNDAANIILIEDGNTQLVDRDDYSDKAEIRRLETGRVPVKAYDDLRTIVETNAPLVISDTKRYLAEHDDMQVHTPWLNSHIGIPIRLEGDIMGFINVGSIQPGLFTQEHAQRLELFAEQAAIAIRNAHLHDKAQELAILEERQRLARNLHDAVSQTLFSASIIAEALPQLWKKNPDIVFPELERIRLLSRSALAEMRSLLLELHPERLLETSMSDLMNQLMAGLMGQTHIDVTLDLPPRLQLPTELHIAAYYITQEALNNVVKHARASHAKISLRNTNQAVTLIVSDNGRGFNTADIASTSLGLNNIQQRARSTQGDLVIDSAPDRGTTITVKWIIGGE